MAMKAADSDLLPGERPDRIKLLIVDDDPTTLQLLALQLEMEGYASTTLSEPGLVLDAITQESPTLILMDYHMGTHAGLDLLQTIRNQAETRYLPIVVMSALDHRRESESAGADGFVLKPFDLTDLVATIHRVLERGRGGTSGQTSNNGITL
jgi:DNA-binding response OmpR family regulator